MSIKTTFRASIHSGIPVENIIFEVVESENLFYESNLLKHLQIVQDFGFKTALDDFSAGHSGLKLIVQYRQICRSGIKPDLCFLFATC
jgi:EAL domain-containing protein (putative c-di-GMP-specific phosphodiesterase class I)